MGKSSDTSVPRKKSVMKKVGHRGIRKTGNPRKRIPKLRLPRNSSGKPYVVMIFHILNSLSEKDRADCLRAIAPYAHAGTDTNTKMITLAVKIRKLVQKEGRE